MEKIGIRLVAQEDQVSVITLLTKAFYKDPLLRWMYEERDAYLAHFKGFVDAYGGAAFDSRSGLTYEDGPDAAILWHPSDHIADCDSLSSFIAETVPKTRRDDVITVFRELAGLHPAGLFRTLTFAGRDPFSYRNASILIRAFCQRCDEDQVRSGGDVTSLAHAKYYRQFGFETIGVVQRGSSPPFYSVLREPRAVVVKSSPFFIDHGDR